MRKDDAINEAARVTAQAIKATDPEARRRLLKLAAEMRAAAEELHQTRMNTSNSDESS